MRRDQYTPDGRFEHDGALVRGALVKLERSVQLLHEYEGAGIGQYAVALPQLERLIKHIKAVNSSYELQVQGVIDDRDALDTDKIEQEAVLKQLDVRSKRTAHRALTEQENAFGTAFMNDSLMFAVGVTSNTGIDTTEGPERQFLHRFGATLAELAEANFAAYPRDLGDTSEPHTTARVAREYFGEFAVVMNRIADSVATELVRASLSTPADSNVILFRPRTDRGPAGGPIKGPGGGIAG